MPEDDYEYAGFWIRVAATLIDTVLILLVTLPLLLAIYGRAYFNDVQGDVLAGPGDFLITWVFPLVAVVLFWIKKQGTPGKLVFSARVVDAATGQSLTVAQSIGRYLAYFVSTIPLGLGFLWVAFDPKKQGWHDKLAGTVVIRSKGGGTEPMRFE